MVLSQSWEVVGGQNVVASRDLGADFLIAQRYHSPGKKTRAQRREVACYQEKLLTALTLLVTKCVDVSPHPLIFGHQIGV